ncbi:MAG: glycosyltransferase family 4 protein [Pseudonocardiales bacterium]|nr:glycosyltransferase family 4 protein [Pseudonocardiales bacterium]
MTATDVAARGLGRWAVLTWLSTATGGAERSVVELAQALAGQGWKVAVVWWDTTNGTQLPIVGGGVDLHRVTRWPAYRAVLAEVLARTPTVVITTHRTAGLDIPLARACGACVIAVLRAVLVPDGRLRMVDPTSGALVGRRPADVEGSVWAGADCWVGVSATATRSLEQVVPWSVCRVTIYNGVPLEAPPLRPRGTTVRAGVVARLELWKRLDRILAALAQLPATLRERVRLDIYGEGPQRAALLSAAERFGIARCVSLHGHRGDWRARGLDVLVCASPDEAFGRAIVEAGLAGIPAIVPAQGGSAELVLPGITGLHFEPDDPSRLASALATVAGWDSATATRFALAARAHARRFDIRSCAATYAALATDLLTQRSRRHPAA